jgi:hypothetical protein
MFLPENFAPLPGEKLIGPVVSCPRAAYKFRQIQIDGGAEFKATFERTFPFDRLRSPELRARSAWDSG